MTTFWHINRSIPKGTVLGSIVFSAMLNDIQSVLSDRSTLVKFADDLILSVLIKETLDEIPQEVENILSWAQSNIMTITLLKLRRRLLRVKLKDLSHFTFNIKQEVFLQLLGVYFYSNPTNWGRKQINSLLSKARRRMHILRVQEEWL